MTASFSTDPSSLLAPIKRLHETIRSVVVEACERRSMETLAAVAREEEGDTIYAVDRISEEVLVDFFEREVAPTAPLVLIAEGLDGGQITLPRGSADADGATLRLPDEARLVSVKTRKAP